MLINLATVPCRFHRTVPCAADVISLSLLQWYEWSQNAVHIVLDHTVWLGWKEVQGLSSLIQILGLRSQPVGSPVVLACHESSELLIVKKTEGLNISRALSSISLVTLNIWHTRCENTASSGISGHVSLFKMSGNLWLRKALSSTSWLLFYNCKCNAAQ